jgi:hypothetical protein
MKLSSKTVAFLASTVLSLSAFATPVPVATISAATAGLPIVATGGNVLVTYEGTTFGSLYEGFLGVNNHSYLNVRTSPAGSSVDLGNFAAGTNLATSIYSNVANGNYSAVFYAGPASNNPDHAVHAWVQAGWKPNTDLVSFNVSYGSQLPTYISYSFSNTSNGIPVPSVPEPETYALMLAGLGLLAAIARRKQQSH